jgi:hypothetical protein
MGISREAFVQMFPLEVAGYSAATAHAPAGDVDGFDHEEL